MAYDPQTMALMQSMQNMPTSADQQNLQTQLQQAQAMRQAIPQNGQMAGKYVVRQSPLAYLTAAASNIHANSKQDDIMKQMQSQAAQLRDVRGKYISSLAAAQDPSSLHPDSQAAIAQAGGTPGASPINGMQVNPQQAQNANVGQTTNFDQ